MARVSSAPEDAFHFKGTFADGWGEIIDAKAVVFQYPPNKETGKQDPPGLFAELTIQRLLDGSGQKSAEQPEQVLLAIQRASRDSGELDSCHPGNYPDGDVNKDPTDAGGELGAEGNTLFAVQDGFQLNDKTKWMSFTASLQEKGFKPDVLKRTYFSDLVGLRAYFKTETRKKFRDDQTTDPTVFVVTEIKQFPYEQGAQKAGGAGAGKAVSKRGAAQQKAAPAPSTQTVAQPVETASASAAAAAAASTNGELPEDIATMVLTDILAPASVGKVLNSVQKLKIDAFMAANKIKPALAPDVKKKVQDQLGNEEWLTSTGLALRLWEIQEDGKIVFAS